MIRRHIFLTLLAVAATAAAASGRVLDRGIGSGLNLPFYGSRTSQVLGVDPSGGLLRLAEERARKAPLAIELLKGSGEALPLDDKSVDTVVMTFTLCTISDAAKAVSEIRRLLKPDGTLLFAEHGRAPDSGVARWQDRMTPMETHRWRMPSEPAAGPVDPIGRFRH